MKQISILSIAFFLFIQCKSGAPREKPVESIAVQVPQNDITKVNLAPEPEPEAGDETEAGAGAIPDDEDALDVILSKLALDKDSCAERFITHAQLPFTKKLSVWVIPKGIVANDCTETFDGYFVLFNNTTKQIENKWLKKDAWVSDAVRLDAIEVDFTLFKLNESTHAFGVRAIYSGHSKPNPYAAKEISLFIPSGDSLLEVLIDYTVYQYNGEWDMRCSGEFKSEVKTFEISPGVTNGFNDIIVRSNIEIITEKDCENTTKKKKSKQQILRYSDWVYK